MYVATLLQAEPAAEGCPMARYGTSSKFQPALGILFIFQATITAPGPPRQDIFCAASPKHP